MTLRFKLHSREFPANTALQASAKCHEIRHYPNADFVPLPIDESLRFEYLGVLAPHALQTTKAHACKPVRHQ
jgi:hypothetical protein